MEVMPSKKFGTEVVIFRRGAAWRYVATRRQGNVAAGAVPVANGADELAAIDVARKLYRDVEYVIVKLGDDVP